MHRDYLDNYRQFDPLQPRNCQSSGLAVVPLGFAMARQPSRDSRRYRDFLQRYGVVDVVEILLIAPASLRPLSPCCAPLHKVLSPQISWLNSVLCRRCCKSAVANMQPFEDSLSALTPKERQIAWLLRQAPATNNWPWSWMSVFHRQDPL